jgi:hypothetical protein
MTNDQYSAAKKNRGHHEGLGTPTSFLPRVARGRMKEGELQSWDRFVV